jgi:hypothetical protein
MKTSNVLLSTKNVAVQRTTKQQEIAEAAAPLGVPKGTTLNVPRKF